MSVICRIDARGLSAYAYVGGRVFRGRDFYCRLDGIVLEGSRANRRAGACTARGGNAVAAGDRRDHRGAEEGAGEEERSSKRRLSPVATGPAPSQPQPPRRHRPSHAALQIAVRARSTAIWPSRPPRARRPTRRCARCRSPSPSSASSRCATRACRICRRRSATRPASLPTLRLRQPRRRGHHSRHHGPILHRRPADELWLLLTRRR